MERGQQYKQNSASVHPTMHFPVTVEIRTVLLVFRPSAMGGSCTLSLLPRTERQLSEKGGGEHGGSAAPVNAFNKFVL